MCKCDDALSNNERCNKIIFGKCLIDGGGDYRWTCLRPKGHTGLHHAHSYRKSCHHIWDDDGKTYKVDPEFDTEFIIKVKDEPVVLTIPTGVLDLF